MDKLWEFSGNCVAGERHKRKHMLCQDRMSYKFKGSRQAIVLLDGIGQTDKNVLAGERIADYIADFLIGQFEVIMTEKEDTVKYLLLRDIYRIIEFLMKEYKMPKEEFASTVMGVCVDHERKKFCIIHLGDGVILRRNDKWNILSYPMNGGNPNQTYLTVSEAALQKMRVFWGSMEDTSGYAMMTDGMYDYPIQIREVIRIAENEGRDWPTEDDRGIVMLRKH